MTDQLPKKIKYTSRDFGSLRDDLISFAEAYYPAVYRDFNEASPGMMFMEMAAYVGDVLSYYTDIQFKESLLLEAEEKENILSLAQAFGYTPKMAVPAAVVLDFYQLVPSVGSGVNNVPDMRYAMTIDANAIVAPSLNSSVNFITNEFIDFSYSSSFNPIDITVYEIDPNTNEPAFYLLRKSVLASSGKIRTAKFDFGNAIPYNTVKITDSKVIDIIDAIDSEGETWYNVPYLSQDTIAESVRNIPRNDRELFGFVIETPYLLKLRKISKRFTTRLLADNSILIQFGPGISGVIDEQITPDPSLYGTILSPFSTIVDESLDPSNFLYTKNYGLAPSNTQLVFRYRVGGGLNDNVAANTLTNILSRTISLNEDALDPSLVAIVKGSLSVSNPDPAVGGRDAETLNEIKTNALAFYAAQNRVVTTNDYLSRVYSMPSRFGSVAKAFVIQDDQLNLNSVADDLAFLGENPNGINIYTLGYNKDGKLTTVNNATKINLLNYLKSFRILTDAINIVDATVINIGINFEITPQPEYSGYEVITMCINALDEYFDITKWQINQPIVVSEIYNLLDRIEGVQTVVNVEFINLHDTSAGYSGNIYNIQYAEKNGLIYPSMDPSIFEIRYPNRDIRGRIR